MYLGKAICGKDDVAIVAAQIWRHASVVHHLWQQLCRVDVRSHAQRLGRLTRNQQVVARDLQCRATALSLDVTAWL